MLVERTLMHSITFLFLQSGPNGASNENLGVNYRALNDLFNISSSRQSSIVYEIGVQIIEIYNEQVRDLLSTDTSVKKYPFFSSYIWFIMCMGFLQLENIPHSHSRDIGGRLIKIRRSKKMNIVIFINTRNL